MIAVLLLLALLVAKESGPATEPESVEPVQAEATERGAALDAPEERITAVRAELSDSQGSADASGQSERSAGAAGAGGKVPWGNYVPRRPEEQANDGDSEYLWEW